jgi:hypothetical protein
MKKEYCSPEFLFFKVELDDIIMGSVEKYSEYVDPTPGNWDDPIIPDDPGIIWDD